MKTTTAAYEGARLFEVEIVDRQAREILDHDQHVDQRAIRGEGPDASIDLAHRPEASRHPVARKGRPLAGRHELHLGDIVLAAAGVENGAFVEILRGLFNRAELLGPGAAQADPAAERVPFDIE